MNRIAALISELCPEGVPFESLDNLLEYEQPGKYLVESTAYSDAYETPVLTAGQTFVLGHTDEKVGIYPASPANPVIIFDDFTTAFKWVDFPFKAKSSAMKMLTEKSSKSIDFRFIYYAMLCINFTPQEHARHWIRRYSNFRVPVPPLEVQREIVRILDHFSELEAALKAELDARRRQYAHYGPEILHQPGENHLSLRGLVEFINGKPHERLVDPYGDISLMTSKFISTSGRMARFVNSADVLSPAVVGDVALVMSDLPNGRALAKAFYVDENYRYAANQRVCLLRAADPEVLNPRYLYYAINRNRQLLAYDSGVDQTHLKKDYILDVTIPLPSLREQARIVTILDAFDTLTTDLSIGLPAELDARRKQYEHYRNLLLTFKELPA